MAHTVQLLNDASDASALDLAVAGDTITAFVVNGEQLVQTAMGVRAPHATPINRGNLQNRIALSITKAPAASPAAAQAAVATLIAAIAAKLLTAQLLDIELGVTLLRLTNAALLSYEISAQGTTVYARYQWTGGALAEVT